MTEVMGGWNMMSTMLAVILQNSCKIISLTAGHNLAKFMDRDSRSPETRKSGLERYTLVLTEQAWSTKNLFNYELSYIFLQDI